LATSSLNLLIPSSFQPSNLLPPFVYSDFGRESHSSASRLLHLATAITSALLLRPPLQVPFHVYQSIGFISGRDNI
jgi:hypothetical protein